MEVEKQTEIIKALARMQQDAATLVIQMLTWRISTEEDDEAVRKDIRKLEWHFDVLKRESGI